MRTVLILFATVLCSAERMAAQELPAGNCDSHCGPGDSEAASSAQARSENLVFSARVGNIAFFTAEPTSHFADLSARRFFRLSAEPAAAAAPDPAPPSPTPKFIYGGRDDFRWQLALGASFVRFRSSVFYASGLGSDTSVTYFSNESLGFEGRFTTAFSPTTFNGAIVKYAGYGGGPKLAWRQRKFEPFVHVLAGGIHMRPQTAFGINAFQLQAGGGAGYRYNPRFSIRIVVDYLRSHLFDAWENSAQAGVQFVLHF